MADDIIDDLADDDEQDPLAELLAESVDNADLEPVFLQAFLKTHVYVLGRYSKNDALDITQWQDEQGRWFIPAFSRLALLDDAVEEDAEYLHILGYDLLEATIGTTVILNPFDDDGWAFSRKEVTALLGKKASAPKSAKPGKKKPSTKAAIPEKAPTREKASRRQKPEVPTQATKPSKESTSSDDRSLDPWGKHKH